MTHGWHLENGIDITSPDIVRNYISLTLRRLLLPVIRCTSTQSCSLISISFRRHVEAISSGFAGLGVIDSNTAGLSNVFAVHEGPATISAFGCGMRKLSERVTFT